MSEPYEGDNAYCGYPIHTDEALRGYIELALEKKQQLLAHCNGDAAAEQYITQFERVLAETGTTNLHRAVMVHAQLVRKDQLQTNGDDRNDPQLFCSTYVLLGRYPFTEFRRETGKPDLSGERCH